MRRTIAIALLLSLITGYWSPVPAFVGMRPYGAANIGPLRDTDSIPIDRVDEDRDVKTTPGDIYTYVYGRINSNVAPAAHGHADASTSAAGFLSALDKLQLDAGAVTTKGEGAAMSGTWTSLATAGYTVISAQARLPYLTANGLVGGVHLIQTADDLAAYGVDWCAIQHAVNKGKGGLVLVNNGTYIIERTVTVPSQTNIVGMSKASFILPHTTWTGTKNLFTVPASSYEITIAGMKLQENPWPNINAGLFTGVFVGEGSWRVRIERNNAVRLAKLVTFDKSSGESMVRGNDCDDVTQEVYYTKGTTDHWHHMPIVDDNYFSHSYRAGYNYAVRAEDNAQLHYFRVTNNRVAYQALFRYYNVLTTVSGTAMFSEISRNRVIGNNNNNGAPLIYWVGNVEYTSKIADNFLWNALYQIAIGGQKGLSITGNTGIDSSSHTRCQVQILAPVTQLLVSGLATLQLGNIPTVCGDYSLAGTGNLPSGTTYTWLNLAGNAVGGGSELSSDSNKTLSDYVKVFGNVDKPAGIASSETLLPDVGSVNAFGDNLTITMCKSERLVIGKRVLIFNYSNTTLTVAGNGTSITKLDGTYGNTMTIPAYSAAEFFLGSYNGTNGTWRQIR